MGGLGRSSRAVRLAWACLSAISAHPNLVRRRRPTAATGLVHSARCVPSKWRIRSGDMIGVIVGVTVGAPRRAFIEDLDFADDLSAALNLEFAEPNLARDAPRQHDADLVRSRFGRKRLPGAKI